VVVVVAVLDYLALVVGIQHRHSAGVRGAATSQVDGRHDERMDDAKAKPRLLAEVAAVEPGTARFERVLALAAQVLAQDRHLTSDFPAAQESCVLGAF
jgi:hypothetical protein